MRTYRSFEGIIFISAASDLTCQNCGCGFNCANGKCIAGVRTVWQRQISLSDSELDSSIEGSLCLDIPPVSGQGRVKSPAFQSLSKEQKGLEGKCHKS